MNSSDPTADARIEAFLDGMLRPEEEAALAKLEVSDPDFASQVALARDIQTTLRHLPAHHAPPEMVAEVLRTARREARVDVLHRMRSWAGMLTGVNLRPVVATASLVILIVASGLLGRPVEDQPTGAEVAEALAQIKWTLALVSEVGEETAFIVRDDVLVPHVVAPMQTAMHSVFEGQAVRN